MMGRIEYAFTLTNVTALHIGSGDTRAATGKEIKARDPQATTGFEIATILTAGGDPWLPGSTLKGALRAQAGPATVKALFGELPQDSSTPLAPGCATVFGAVASGAKVILRRRNRVHPGTGAAEANLLFAQEWVAPGARFALRVILSVPPGDPDQLGAAFEAILAQFAAPRGLPAAKDKADGMGRLRLDGPVTKRVHRFTNGAWTEQSATPLSLPAPATVTRLHSLTLTCPGPYLARGPVETRRHGAETRQTTMPERDGNLPLLAPSGVSGALRKRAEWLIARDGLANPARRCTTSSGQRDLTAAERLFGAEGYRAALTVDVHGISRTGTSTHTMVPLDPLTQAPLQGIGPFNIAADHGVKATLDLDARRDLDDDEKALLDALVADIGRDGLMLGAMTTKGFGWFNGPPLLSTTIPKSQNGPLASADETARRPDPRITLPYRLIAAAENDVGMPEEAVRQAFRDRTLHSQPLPGSVSGWLDVTWVFETPLLVGDGGAPTTAPQRLGDDFVIPGPTLCGVLRNVLDHVTQSRLSRVNTPKRGFPLAGVVDRIKASPAHNPPLDDSFTPDFCQALFGFVLEGGAGGGPQRHERMHLKSRLGFGFAHRISAGPPLLPENVVKDVAMTAPDSRGVFYDILGRKRYLTTTGNADTVRARLAAARHVDNAAMRKNLVFLGARGNSPLAFRGRIRFTNLTPAELGALVFAVTLGLRAQGRHQIGHARPHGAGRCYAGDLHLHLSHAANPVNVKEPDKNDAPFGVTGSSLEPFAVAFINYWRREIKPFADPALAAFLASCLPSYGTSLRTASGLRPGELGYQTKQKLTDNDPDALDDITAENGGVGLAPMLKP